MFRSPHIEHTQTWVCRCCRCRRRTATPRNLSQFQSWALALRCWTKKNIDQLMSRTRRQKSDCDEWVFVSHTMTFLYALLHLQETHCGWRRDVTDSSINSSDCWINHRKIKSHLCPERERKHPASNFWSQGHKRKLCCRKKLQMVARSPWISRPQGGARWAL